MEGRPSEERGINMIIVLNLAPYVVAMYMYVLESIQGTFRLKLLGRGDKQKSLILSVSELSY